MVSKRKAKKSLKRAKRRIKKIESRVKRKTKRGETEQAAISQARLDKGNLQEKVRKKKKELKTATPTKAPIRVDLTKKQPKRTVLPTIDIGGPKKKGIGALVQKDTLAGKAAKVLTSPKTTIVLGSILGTLLGVGAATNVARGAGVARAVITKTLSTRMGSMTTQRAFVGRAAQTGIKKLFQAGGQAAARAPTAMRFATNTQSMRLTTKLLIGAGLTAGAASMAVTLMGTYPFAAFIGKEEAAQTLSLPMWQAIEIGDLEGAQTLLDQSNELVNAEPQIVDKIPILNVMEAVRDNIGAVRNANVEWQRIIDLLKEEGAASETQFQKERRESDEAAFERKREFAAEEAERFGKIQEEGDERRRKQIAEDAERFAEIKETADEERAAQIAEDEKRFAEIREANQQREMDELRFKEEYFALIRDGRFDEAAALLDAYEAGLKGG